MRISDWSSDVCSSDLLTTPADLVTERGIVLSGAIMSARIFQKPKNAMQSGRAQTDKWVLEFEPADAQRPDPLTGWAGSADTRRQVKLMFPTLEAAKASAAREGITYHVVPAPHRDRKRAVWGKRG